MARNRCLTEGESAVTTAGRQHEPTKTTSKYTSARHHVSAQCQPRQLAVVNACVNKYTVRDIEAGRGGRGKEDAPVEFLWSRHMVPSQLG